MNIYRPTFIRKVPVAADTLAFFFEKPADFTFVPGQFITIQLPGDPAVLPERGRYDFSIASAPNEKELLFVTRMRDTHFKRHLASLNAGNTVEIEGPFGHMILPDDANIPVVLLAGGIGIVPFRSMIVDALGNNAHRAISLICSNRTRVHATFFDELQQLSRRHANFRFIPVMTQEEAGSQAWAGEKGYFTPQLLGRYLENTAKAMYYIVGPVKMVISTKRMVRAMGVAEEQIQMEVFTGY